ncbi:hypothetical protein AEGHOMDF_5117 [Methylobacterium soli]|nr:hypothetical protein AEGHOMDF_5117 [Methylobacterium soli]
MLAIDVGPLELQHLGLARAGEQQQPYGASRRRTLGLRRCPRGGAAPAGLNPGGQIGCMLSPRLVAGRERLPQS